MVFEFGRFDSKASYFARV